MTHTKAQLQTEIDRLKQVIRDQKSVLESLSDKQIDMTPVDSASVRVSHAPYIESCISGQDSFTTKVIPIIFKVIKQYSKQRHVPGSGGKAHVSFMEAGYGYGDVHVLPKVVGDILVDFINAAGDFGNDCWSAGMKEGTNLLTQLANGELTQAAFEDRVGRELAIEKQKSWKRFKAHSYK